MELWIARDKNGYLGLYKTRPIWMSGYNGIKDWYVGEYACLLPKESFPEVTFENSPRKVEIKLKD